MSPGLAACSSTKRSQVAAVACETAFLGAHLEPGALALRLLPRTLASRLLVLTITGGTEIGWAAQGLIARASVDAKALRAAADAVGSLLLDAHPLSAVLRVVQEHGAAARNPQWGWRCIG